MDDAQVSELAHTDLRILNPISSRVLDETIGTLDLMAGAAALDIGCGKGELLLRLAERHGTRGLGIDLSANYIAAARDAVIARGPHPAPEFEAGDVRHRQLQAGAYALAACIGASHASGAGTRGALSALKTLVRPGGQILLGEGFWERNPSPAFLSALGAERDELADYGGTIRMGLELGLTPLYARVASQDDWDRYEWSLVDTVERYVAGANPAAPGVGALREYADRIRTRMLMPDGRGTLGFGLFVFQR